MAETFVIKQTGDPITRTETVSVVQPYGFSWIQDQYGVYYDRRPDAAAPVDTDDTLDQPIDDTDDEPDDPIVGTEPETPPVLTAPSSLPNRARSAMPEPTPDGIPDYIPPPDIIPSNQIILRQEDIINNDLSLTIKKKLTSDTHLILDGIKARLGATWARMEVKNVWVQGRNGTELLAWGRDDALRFYGASDRVKISDIIFNNRQKNCIYFTPTVGDANDKAFIVDNVRVIGGGNAVYWANDGYGNKGGKIWLLGNEFVDQGLVDGGKTHNVYISNKLVDVYSKDNVFGCMNKAGNHIRSRTRTWVQVNDIIDPRYGRGWPNVTAAGSCSKISDFGPETGIYVVLGGYHIQQPWAINNNAYRVPQGPVPIYWRDLRIYSQPGIHTGATTIRPSQLFSSSEGAPERLKAATLKNVKAYGFARLASAGVEITPILEGDTDLKLPKVDFPPRL